MKKTGLSWVILIISLMVLAACSEDSENTNTVISTNETGNTIEVPEGEVRLTVSLNDGEQFINEQQVKIEEGANLLDVLKKTFYVETDDNNEITSIERMKVSEEDNTTWKLFVNDKLSDVSAKDYTLNGGERITLDLQ